MIKVGDKVIVMMFGFAHSRELNTKPLETELLVTGVIHQGGFYVDEKYYYDDSDVAEHFTPKKDPERFL